MSGKDEDVVESVECTEVAASMATPKSVTLPGTERGDNEPVPHTTTLNMNADEVQTKLADESSKRESHDNIQATSEDSRHVQTRTEGVGTEIEGNSNEIIDGKSEVDLPNEDESEDEGIDGSAEVLDKAARDNLYEKGQQYETKNKKKLALKCYLQCLRGLSGGSEFSFLPQCLRKVADLYFQQEELEKAIQFIQAEKMYYETALIDTSELQKKVEQRRRSQEDSPESTEDANCSNPDAVRAEEFEKLAKLCLEKNQAQLALEYQGKATKLRQKIYGHTHEITTRSLDFFTIIYGEVGKQQYSESMQKLTKSTGETENPVSSTSTEDSGGSPPGSPTSILRRRNLQRAESKEEKHVRFTEPERAREKREHEEYISKAILWVLFFLCLVLLAVISHYIYCKVDVHSTYCTHIKSDFYYYYMRFKYLVYFYTTPTDDESNIG